MRQRVAAIAFLFTIAIAARATEPPRPNSDMADDYAKLLEQHITQKDNFRHGLMPMVAAATANRATVEKMSTAAGEDETVQTPELVIGPTAVVGVRAVPVLTAKYTDTGSDPFQRESLQAELFSEEWPPQCMATNTCTGTMRQFYTENSYGRFTVTGTVTPWVTLPHTASFYQGSDFQNAAGETRHCKGLCSTAKIGQFVIDTIAANPNFPWEQYDNDGPDAIPNSGDDDGFVDFVAIVQPSIGGECRNDATGIWSHRSNLSNMSGGPLVTKRPTVAGGFIRIDDYVITPSFACDGTTMIQIGVFAHEFGHAFGLPDLYDTRQPARWSGLGNWCLMASGSWGGDGDSPERPSHMSPWAKQYLGWLTPLTVTADSKISVDGFESTSFAYRIPISTKQYYLVTNISRGGFNVKLPVAGVAVWKINDSMVQPGLRNNTVNADPANRGITLVEADGHDGLGSPAFRGGDGDLFPGVSTVRNFDATTVPKAVGKVALCGISDAGPRMNMTAFITGRKCGGQAIAAFQPAAVQNISALAPALEALPDFASKAVTISGTISNAGTNLFTDRQLVFVDDNGTSIPVTIAAPLEFPASPSSATASVPDLGNLYGKPVRITGTIQQRQIGNPLLVISAVQEAKAK
jgi:M6 family metalloprotease-like protein